MLSLTKFADAVVRMLSRGRSYRDSLELVGEVTWELCGADGLVKRSGKVRNRVITNGDNYIAGLMRGGSCWTYRMKLDSSSTAPNKNDATSYTTVANYIPGTVKAMEATWPRAGASDNITQFKGIWNFVGVCSNINSASLVDNATDAGEADATHTLARAVLSGIPINAIAGDQLTITWDIQCQGA